MYRRRCTRICPPFHIHKRKIHSFTSFAKKKSQNSSEILSLSMCCSSISPTRSKSFYNAMFIIRSQLDSLIMRRKLYTNVFNSLKDQNGGPCSLVRSMVARASVGDFLNVCYFCVLFLLKLLVYVLIQTFTYLL